MWKAERDGDAVKVEKRDEAAKASGRGAAAAALKVAVAAFLLVHDTFFYDAGFR